ncbi:MAG: TonB-dependent receptor [Sphingobacteriales bacterium]|nr:TonB-dependent receptor [Sphingobacteriales bacterium]
MRNIHRNRRKRFVLRTYILLCWLLLSSMWALSQSGDKYGFTLVVVNRLHQAVSGATVRLLKAGQLIGSAAANNNGQAIFTDLGKGTYTCLVSATAYRPITTHEYSLPGSERDTVVLEAVHDVLAEVTVNAHIPPIEVRREKTVLNVDASVTSTGATVEEVLERSPGVTMDKNGNISLNGRQGVLVMIDDKPTYLSGEDLVNLLTSMSASTVSKIELIFSPPARYDAAGNAGIINIKTKKNSNNGFNGAITTSYGQGVYPKSNNSLVLNLRKAQVNSFLNFTNSDVKYLTDLYAYRKYYDASNQNVTAILEQPSYFSGTLVNNTIKTGLDYTPSSRTTLGLVLTGVDIHRHGNNTSHADWQNPNGTPDSSILTRSTPINSFKNGAINLNARQTLSGTTEISADFDYLHYQLEGKQNFDNQLSGPGGYDEIFRSDFPTTINIFSGKVDGTVKMGPDASFQAGLKTSSSHTDNTVVYENWQNQQWVKDDSRSNHFVYQENIQAAYASYEGKAGRISYQGGLRYEYTSYTARQSGNSQQPDSNISRNYASFFPNTSLSYKVDSLNSLNLLIGRRTDRPIYQNLNPFAYVINKYTYLTGNPYLLPQYTWNFELSHQYKDLLTTGISYSLTTNYFSQLFLSDTTKTILYYTQGNVGHVYNIGISASLNLSPAPWWSMQLSAIFNHKQLRGFNGNEYTTTINQLHVNIDNQLTFGKGYVGELSGFYTTRARQDIQEILYATGQMAAGISKTVLKKKGTVKLSMRDIFRANAMEGFTSFPNATEYYRFKRDSRVVTLTFVFRFGQSFKSSRHEDGATEEKERVQNG